MPKKKYSQLDYCQYLWARDINYTITHLPEHLQTVSYDSINRYLKTEKLTPSLLCKTVKNLIIFDDTVLDKRYIAILNRLW